MSVAKWHVQSFVGVLVCASLLFCIWQLRGYREICCIIEQYEHARQGRQQPAAPLENDTAVEEELFTVLNRTPEYLREMAVSFARAHDLDQSVQQLYTASSSEPIRQQKVRAKKKKVARRRQFSEADFSRWDALKKVEPLFDLPIDRNNFWLSSPFGVRRRPGGGRQFHFGIDMAAVRGTPVKAAGDGVVIQAGHQPGYGNVVVVKHDAKFKTRYAHLSKILVRSGAQVQTGEILGKVGSTGNARASGKTRDASHLHFEVEMYGKRVNPFYFFK